MARMDDEMPWFRDLSAEDRSWVSLIVQAGIKSFIDWYADEVRHPDLDGSAVAAQVFGAAPRALAGVISLQQTVDLVRLGIEVVESNLDGVLDPEDAHDVLSAVLRYGREVAFATAEVYARAAEVRGAWDARLEALVVDSVLRAEADETMLSRASALGWADRGAVTVVLGSVQSRAPRRGPVRRGTPRGPGRRHGRALRHPGRPPGRDPGRGQRHREGRPARARLLRPRPGRGRTGGRGPRARPRQRPQRHLRTPGRHRLAGRPAPGPRRRPAARARARRRRPRAAAPGRGGLPPARSAAGTPWSRRWRRTSPADAPWRPAPARSSATRTP